MPNDVADRVADLTPAWLSHALQRAAMTWSSPASRPSGSARVRWAPPTAWPSPMRARPARATLIAKLAGDDEAMRAMVAAGYAAEVGFYQHLAPGLEVRTPGCWYAAITEERTSFSLLLDDAAPAQPGVQADGCTVGQARASIRNLVGLHTPRWGDVGLHDLASCCSPARTWRR